MNAMINQSHPAQQQPPNESFQARAGDIRSLLRQNNLFSVLPDSEIDNIIGHLQTLSFQAGETVMEQGSPAAGIYLINKGKVRIVDLSQPDKPIVLNTLGDGDSFGERSVVNHSEISATVQAAEDLTLLQLSTDYVEQLFARSPALRQQFKQRIEYDLEFNFLRTLKLLSGLNRREIQTLSETINTIHLNAGEYLFHEGDLNDLAYIIRSGEIRIVKESADNAELAIRGVGELFGEMSVQSDQPTMAGAYAISDCTLLCLSKQAYDFIISKEIARDAIEREIAQRQLVNETVLYHTDTLQGRMALLSLLHEENGVERFWQRVRQDKQSADQALQSMSRATGLDYLTPSSHVLVDPELVHQIPAHYAQANQVLPVFATQNRTEVLASTPFLGTLPAELSQILGSPISLRLTEPQFLAKLIETSIAEGEGLTGSLSNMDGGDNWDELDSIEDLKDQAQAAPIIKLVNNVFMEAISRKTSDIHIEPYEDGLEVRYRIDGILQVVSTAPRRFQAAIVSRIKIMANLDISERRIPQDGRISLRLEAKNFDIRVATVPTVFGEGVVMRILDKSSVQIQLSDVGFAPAMLEQWQWAAARPNGVVLVTGPTGSGKTTTLYATLNYVKNPEVKIITAEDPVEYQLHGIKQIQVDAKVKLTFAAALRSMLRLDPDIIMVGEIRDFETAEIAIQAALTGHLVFSTLHTNDAPTAVTRLVEMGIAPYLVASAVTAVLAQRLVRKLCMNCREQNQDGHWQAVGCSQCEGSGYKGRLGIYELMIINDDIRELIIANKDATVIAAEARKHGLLSLSQDGRDKVAQGQTTMDEIKRVAG